MAYSAFDSFFGRIFIRFHEAFIILKIAIHNLYFGFNSRVKFKRALQNSTPPADFETFYSSGVRSIEVQEQDRKLSRALLACYFTMKPNPHYGTIITEPEISYIAPWYDSVAKLDLHGIIMHDGLSPDFIARHQTDKIQFRKYNAGNYSIFEERWFAYYLFISLTNMDYVICSDANDVYITADPFAFVTDKERIYIGRDRANKIKDSGWILEELATYEQDSGYKAPKLFQYQKMYNAGIMGGSRQVMLLLISNIIRFALRAQTNTHKDMTLINLVIYKFFSPPLEYKISAGSITDPSNDLSASGERLFSGYPLNSAFYQFELDSKAVFIHK